MAPKLTPEQTERLRAELDKLWIGPRPATAIELLHGNTEIEEAIRKHYRPHNGQTPTPDELVEAVLQDLNCKE